MAVIELLCYAGIIEKVETIVNEKIVPEWILGYNWDKKFIYLCLDGLSLDWHRSFQKRLMKLQVTFKKAYQQGMVFRKALDRVIEVPGPLHQAFHIIQCIYNLYNFLMKWCGSVLGWKKIKYSEVSQSFHMCRQLLFIVLEELERLAWDKFICEDETKIKTILKEHDNSDDVVKRLGNMYLSFCSHHRNNSSSDYTKYMFNFIHLANKFKIFWESCQVGDCVTQESIMIELLGVFHILNKSKYF
mmetsp:Transcript_13333/g.19067  ORF Transcript_13333/g.19067 Transcript_13333/m.19067 type:complete len:244 (-) Transcript_13333:212-943(-)